MFPTVMSNSTSLSEDPITISSITRVHDFATFNPILTPIHNSSSNNHPQKIIKKKRNLPGNPDPDAEVIALSPKTLLATNRFVCEICNKGFQRDQNLQLHRRGHNLPWKLKQRSSKEMMRKRAYVCPEPTCVHHHPSRALGDLTGIKKHFCRKHGEKKWKCEKCSKIYAVQSDWKAHSKTCGTREYRCDCGTLFSRKDSFITHRAFCDALAEESARLLSSSSTTPPPLSTTSPPLPPPRQLFHLNPQISPSSSSSPSPSLFSFSSQQRQSQQQFSNPPIHISLNPWDQSPNPNPNPNPNPIHHIKPESVLHLPSPPPLSSPHFFRDHLPPPPPQPQHHQKTVLTSPFRGIHASTQPATAAAHMSATALLQRAATVGHVTSNNNSAAVNPMGMGELGMAPEYLGFGPGNHATWQKSDRFTRDFLGLTGECGGGDGGNGNGNGNVDVNVNINVNVRDLLSFRRGVEYPPVYEQRDHPSSLMKQQQPQPQGFGGFADAASEAWGNY